MIVAIIAGGSGTRLWPLSTPDYPKHLLKLNGDEKSLLQRTYQRAKKLTNKIYIVSVEGHIEHVMRQLPELPRDAFICEPGRRGTANCIIAALEHIGKIHDPDEPVASIHADHYIRDVLGFEYSFKVATTITQRLKRLVLIGVEPDNPATSFGYIEKGKPLSEHPLVFDVKSFKEKPDFQTALKYLRSGNYLWNCGYFVGSVNTFKEAMKNYAPALFANFNKLSASDASSYKEVYLSFDNAAIDIALIEKVPNLAVFPATFDWMDLGSFNDLSAAIGGDQSGNTIEGQVMLEEVENSFIQNNEDKPVAVIGLDNIVVVNTKDGILVARKDLSQKVGEISKMIYKNN